MEPRLRGSPEQFSVLIEFMERHGDLSRPLNSAQGRLRGDRMWTELATLLNSVGGGVQKTPDKWKKVWADWKSKTKKKYLAIRQHANRTGGGPRGRLALTALEERVVAIIGLTAVDGQAVEEQGFNTANEVPVRDNIVIPIVLEIPPSQNNTVPPTQSLSGPPTQPLSGPPTQPLSGPPTQPLSGPPSPLFVQMEQNLAPLPPPSPQIPNEIVRPPAASRQTRASPRTATSPRSTRPRRNRGLTPFDRAASEFVDVERRRLQHEEARDQRLHEREMERLRLESQRIEVARETNSLLSNLCIIGNSLISILNNRDSLPSTEILDE